MEIDVNRWWARIQLTGDARLRLYRKIATMLSNGLPLLKVLEEIQYRASEGGRKPNEALAVVLDDWRRAVQNGCAVSAKTPASPLPRSNRWPLPRQWPRVVSR